MLSSKANAALIRLKEIEEKYKMKRKEEKWKHKEESSISSISIDPSENFPEKVKQSSKNILKLKLDIKMPNARIENPIEDTKLSSKDKDSTSSRMSQKSLEAVKEVDLDVTMSLKHKLPRAIEKQESFNSDVTSIQENSSIESVLDDSINSFKSLSNTKKSQQFPKIKESSKRDVSNVYEENTKTSSRLRKKRESNNKSSENSKKRFSKSSTSSNSSITRRSGLSEKSEGKISKLRSDPKTRQRLSKEEEIIRTSEIVSFAQHLNVSNSSESVHGDSVIDESIGTIVDGSEIISELSSIEGRAMDKTENVPVNISGNLLAENVPTYISNNSKYPIIENGYANDTFEDFSSSTMRSYSESQGEEMIEGKNAIDNNAGFSMKRIAITSNEEYRSYRNSAENQRNGQVTELVAAKTTHSASDYEINTSNKELPNYVQNLKNIDTISDEVVSYLLKLPKSSSPCSEKRRKHYKHRKELFKENVQNASSVIYDSAKSSVDNVTKMDKNVARVQRECSRRKSSQEIRMTSVSSQQESVRKECGKASDGTRERAMIDVSVSPMVDDEEKIELAKSNPSEEENGKGRGDDNALEKSSHRLISESAANVTSVLRKLHRDANNSVVKQYTTSLKTIMSESSSKVNDKEVQDATSSKFFDKRENEIRHSCGKNEMKLDNESLEHNAKGRKKNLINLKPNEGRKCNENRKENTALGLDGKQIHRLRKRIVELKLQQERESLQKYMHEFKELRLRLGSCPAQNYFSPLEFPKIAEFTHYDADIKSKMDDQQVLRERISAIKQWLKNQYILYRDYCAVTEAINAHYVPTTLEDAKKVGDFLLLIYDLQFIND